MALTKNNRELSARVIHLSWITDKISGQMTGNRYKIEFLMSWTQKLKGLAAASLGLKTFDDKH